MKILVTGATGTNGKQIATILLEKKLEVRVGVRDTKKAEELAKLGAEVVELDWSKPETIDAAFDGCDRAFLLYPMLPTGWIALAKAAIEAAKKAGVKFLLEFSASGANPEGPLVAHEHGQCEIITKESGIDYAIIQPTFFMENFVNFHAGTIKEQGAFYGASGEGKIAYIASEDISNVAATILAEPDAHIGQTYVLTGGEALSDADAAKIIAEIIGKEVKYIDVPNEAYKKSLDEKGFPEFMSGSLAFLEQVKFNNWAATVSPAVQTILGKEPVKLKDFILQMVAAFK